MISSQNTGGEFYQQLALGEKNPAQGIFTVVNDPLTIENSIYWVWLPFPELHFFYVNCPRIHQGDC